MSAQPEHTWRAFALGSPVTVSPQSRFSMRRVQAQFEAANYRGWVIGWDDEYILVSTDPRGNGGWDYFSAAELTLREGAK